MKVTPEIPYKGDAYDRLFTELSPSWPLAFEPQHLMTPLSSAHVLFGQDPMEIETSDTPAPLSPEITTGVDDPPAVSLP